MGGKTFSLTWESLEIKVALEPEGYVNRQHFSGGDGQKETYLGPESLALGGGRALQNSLSGPKALRSPAFRELASQRGTQRRVPHVKRGELWGQQHAAVLSPRTRDLDSQLLELTGPLFLL